MALAKMMLENGGISSQDVAVESVSIGYGLAVGMKAFSGGKEYVYGQAGETIASGAMVFNDGAHSFKELAEADGIKGQVCAVALIAFTNAYYGWFLVRGSGASIKSASVNLANVVQKCTTTDGEIDDAGTTSILGIRTTAAVSGGFVTADIVYPHTAV